MISVKIAIFIIYSMSLTVCEDYCYIDECPKEDLRYLFYDVNPSEGFNLRRDVYMRMAMLSHKLKNSNNPSLNKFVLVLPPWSHLVHWSYSEIPEHIPWSRFFDLSSLQKFAPVIELTDYFNYLRKHKYTKVIIDNVFILQHFEKMFETGKFVEKWKLDKCQRPPKLRFFHYQNITSNNIQCLSFHGPVTKLNSLLAQTKARTILFDHAEVALHDQFGSKIYWEARRSMRFNRKLREIANHFRKMYLNSTDENDNTLLDPDWRNDKHKRNAVGGPYLSVHLRRRDFLRSRPDQIPDLDSVADQISQILNKLNLKKVFIATDASQKEYDELKSKLVKNYEVYRYSAPNEVERKFLEGEIAIIDQIICSYARYFTGTTESTFSFRIQEEREILGFPSKTTFNVLCKDKNNCPKPSLWEIVY